MSFLQIKLLDPLQIKLLDPRIEFSYVKQNFYSRLKKFTVPSQCIADAKRRLLRMQ